MPRLWDWLMEDLDESRATYVLDTAPAGIFRWDRYPVRDFPRLRADLRDHYDEVGVVERVRIFRRRGDGGDGGATAPRPASNRGEAASSW